MLRYVWIALVAVGCKYPDPGGFDAGGDDGAPFDSAYVVAQRTLDGATTKVAVVPSIDVYGELDLPAAKTFGAHTAVFVANQKVFVATDRAIRRYAVVGNALVEDGPSISFLATNLTQFSDDFVVLGPDLAWFFDQTRSEAYSIDLAAMTTSTAIFYSTLNFTDHVVKTTGAYLVGDIVYVPYYFLQASNALFIETELYVAQFSLSGQQLTTTTSATSLRSSRCARAHPFARLADDTLLFLGDSGSLYDLVTPQIAANCLVRVHPNLPGEIDSGFSVTMDDLTSPEMGASHPVQLGERAITWARDASHYTTQAEWDASSRWRPQTTDLTNLSTEKVTSDDAVSSVGAPGTTFFVDDRPYFLVPDATGTGSGLWADDGEAYLEHAHVSGTLTLIARVR